MAQPFDAGKFQTTSDAVREQVDSAVLHTWPAITFHASLKLV
jgi:hypothetical protein